MSDYGRLDHWSLKAQKEGYPARSVYKLKEMDEKFGLIPPYKAGATTFKVLDLGAAPGSWSIYILRKLHERTKTLDTKRHLLVSVDLYPLSGAYDNGLFSNQDFVFIRGDITQSETRMSIIRHGPYNLLLSDAAPATTGNRSVDTLRSLDLAETALSYAKGVLATGGDFVVKVFQGGDTSNLLRTMRGFFHTAKSIKPQACRAGSFETYYVGLKKK